MKRKITIVMTLALVLSLPTALSQSLSEKRYNLAPYNEQIYSSLQYIPSYVSDGEAGYVMASSSLLHPTGSQKAVIQRTDIEGNILWTTEYIPSLGRFDEDLLIKSHRVGYLTQSENTVGNIVVVGQVSNNGTKSPGYIELDPISGNVINEKYFTWSSDDYEGHLNAVHTLDNGTYRGTYMVGQYNTLGPKHPSKSPILIREGSASNFAILSHVNSNNTYVEYLDVDVDEDNGDIITCGYRGGSYRRFGSYPVIDVYDNSGVIKATHRFQGLGDDDAHRFTCVKSIGPDRAIVGGSMYYNGTTALAVVLEVNLVTGQIIWIRNITTGAPIGENPIEVEQVSEVIEIELDKEAMPIIMAISRPQDYNADPEGPGIFARLNNNGSEDWAVSDYMDNGYGDLEPQHEDLLLLSSLTGYQSHGFTNKLTFAEGNLSGFSGCQSNIEFETPVFWDEINVLSTTYGTITLDEHINTPAYINLSFDEDPGCCFLPHFNPLPWNHPWETTYWDVGPAQIDAGPGFTYKWYVSKMTNIHTGIDITAGNSPCSPCTTQSISIPMIQNQSPIWVGSPINGWRHSAERSLVQIYVTDASDCKGYDGTYVQIADDQYHNRPDYTQTANIGKNPNYAYRETPSTSNPMYIYMHRGWNLSSGGFDNGVTTPYNILNAPGNNLLSSAGLYSVNETVVDAFQASPTRTNYVETDFDVIPSAIYSSCGYTLPGSAVIDEIKINGRKTFSISVRNAPIVKYMFSLHMTDISAPYIDPDKLSMVKRGEMYNPNSGAAIEGEDFLLPTIDDRYFKGNSAYAGNQTLHLDIWYTNNSTYPYSICDHERIELYTAPVLRKGKPGGSGNSSQTASNTKNQDPEINVTDSELSLFTVFPNPSKGLYQLNGLGENTTVDVMDVHGRKLIESFRPKNGASEILIDLSKYENGIYFMQVQTNEGLIRVVKLIKE